MLLWEKKEVDEQSERGQKTVLRRRTIGRKRGPLHTPQPAENIVVSGRQPDSAPMPKIGGGGGKPVPPAGWCCVNQQDAQRTKRQFGVGEDVRMADWVWMMAFKAAVAAATAAAAIAGRQGQAKRRKKARIEGDREGKSRGWRRVGMGGSDQRAQWVRLCERG